MAKSKVQSTSESLAAPLPNSPLPVPVTETEFQRDVLVLYVQQMRALAWMSGKDSVTKVWQLLGKEPQHPNDIFDPDQTVDDIGLTWSDIERTDFAKYLQSMYQYGYFGIYDANLEPMEDETAYTWFSAILSDLKNSSFLEEWSGGYSGEGTDSARRCHEVAELANARRTLERGHCFSYLLGANMKEEDYLTDGQLTVRQLSLLSGMEEMSIRAAANPNRVNPLPIIEEEKKEKRTRFAVEAAKAWLQSKGRYVPITVRNRVPDRLDLKTSKFLNVDHLRTVIVNRLSDLQIAEDKAKEIITKKFRAVFSNHGMDEFDQNMFLNSRFVLELGEVLGFPPKLFALRVREVLAKEELETVKHALKAMDLSAP